MSLVEALTFYNMLIEDPVTGEYSYNYASAFELFDRLHNGDGDGDGDGDVQYYLYECYKYGRGVSKNTKRADKYLHLSLEQDCSKALCEFAKTSAEMYQTSAFENNDERINIIAHILETFEMAIERDNVKAKYQMAYFLFNTVLAIGDRFSAQSSAEYKETFEQVVGLLNAASAADYPDAIFMIGDLINKSRTTNSELRVSNAQDAYPRFYLKAAKYGCMHAVAPICEMYLESKDYAKMTWWYWWARKYDNTYKNGEIDKIIKNDVVLSVINAYMSEQKTYYNIKKRPDNRLHEEVTKMWFLNAYHDGIRLVDLVPYYDKVDGEELRADKSKSPEYNNIVEHINATKVACKDVVEGSKYSTCTKTILSAPPVPF